MKKSALYWYIHTLWVGWCYGQNRREHVFFFTEIQNTTIADSSGEWKPVDYTFEHGERPPMYSAVKGLLLLSFRAYMISIHISRPPGSSISVWLDGKQSNFPFVHEAESTLLNANSSFLDSRLDEMFVMDANLTSGDHQLLVDATGSEEHPVIFDRVEALTIGSSLVPTNYTTMASSLPAGTLVDDSDVLLRHSDSGWQRKEDPFCWENTLAVTSTPGSWLQVTFIGTGIWIYGVIPLEGTVVTIEALKKDGRETTRNTTMYNITRSDLDAPLYQAPLITQERLPYANAYAYNVTLISGSLQFDFMKIAGNIVPYGTGDIQMADNAISQRQTNPSSVVVPAVCGAISALAVGLGLVLLYKVYRRRRESPRGSEEDTKQLERNTQITSLRTISPSPSPSPERSENLVPIPPVSPSLQNSTPQETSRRDRRSDASRRPIRLSHSDLAQVFQRADAIRNSHVPEERLEGIQTQLNPRLEAIAQRLAIRGSVTEEVRS